jgi:hypothetical protein
MLRFLEARTKFSNSYSYLDELRFKRFNAENELFVFFSSVCGIVWRTTKH